MANVSVAILGMGRIGASVALALKRYNERKDAKHFFVVTPTDLRSGVREDAVAVGVGDKIERDLFTSVAKKDIVVVAMPLADVQDTYKSMAAELRSGAVILDMSLLKQQSLDWADKYLSKEVYTVGMTPIINPQYLHDGLDDTLHAAHDLFDKGSMLIMPGPHCAKEAVELAIDFAGILGSIPHFFDPAEHDGIIGLTEGLPALLGVASFYMALHSSGWGDAQRVTNPAFGRLTHHLFDTHPDDLRDLLLQNSDSIVRKTDELISTLQGLRDILARKDQNGLEAVLEEAADTYNDWINKRSSGKWDDSKSDVNGASFASNMMTGLMGGFLANRLKGDKNGEEKK